MIKYLFFAYLLIFQPAAYGTLAGGRPNAISEGQNAFAGVINPANAVWIPNRIDGGIFLVQQKSSIHNHDNNPLFLPGKTDLNYKSNYLFTPDLAMHKHFLTKIGKENYDSSFSLAAYTTPSYTKIRTKNPIPIAGTTPILNTSKVDVISAVFSLKLNKFHSIGFTIDYLHFSHERKGFQNSDNERRSISPGNVTNNGNDHSNGLGLSIGWRWNITEKFNFGAAWSKKSYCGQFRKYRGYEPHYGENFSPQLLGAGMSYKFTSRVAGRLEVLWSNLGNLPAANNNVLPNGKLNLNKRGSKKSPGPGVEDATYINMGIGYKLNSLLSVGAGYSHRLKPSRKNINFVSHIYRIQTIYDIISLGANCNYLKHNIFLGISYGFKNKVSGYMPVAIGGGKFTSEKQNASLSFSWGYLY